MFELVMESDPQGLRKNYLLTLENINKFARINNIEELIFWVRQRYESTLDLMCNFQFEDGLYEY